MRQTRFSLAHPAPAFLFLLTATVVAGDFLLSLHRRAEDRRHLLTGSARWIWLSRGSEEREPIRFYAAREFTWNGSAAGPSHALLFVDRRSSLFANGRLVGKAEQRPGGPLRDYDLTPFLRPGVNRVVIEAESPDGVGGILFALRLGGGGLIVSDGSWRVARSESDLPTRATAARVWGRPPMYPWGYPRPAGSSGFQVQSSKPGA